MSRGADEVSTDPRLFNDSVLQVAIEHRESGVSPADIVGLLGCAVPRVTLTFARFYRWSTAIFVLGNAHNRGNALLLFLLKAQ